MEFHDKIKKIRKQLGLTQQQVSASIGITYQKYQKLEHGKSKPSFDTLIKLCRFFNVSSNYLLGLDEFIVDKSPKI